MDSYRMEAAAEYVKTYNVHGFTLRDLPAKGGD